jgi:hypothetical protein
MFDSATSSLVWSVGSLSDEQTCSSRFKCSDGAVGAVVQVEFKVQGWTASGLRLDSLDVGGVGYTPFKGSRYSSEGGSIDVRVQTV